MSWLYRHADRSRSEAETQGRIAANKSAALEVKTKELKTIAEDLKESQQKAENNAIEAQTKAKEAEDSRAVADRESQRARTAEQAANTALIQATSLRLAAEGQALLLQSRPGNSFQGVLLSLASHRIFPGVELTLPCSRQYGSLPM